MGRWGGEEFVIALPSCTIRTGTRIAERMRGSIGAPLDLSGPGPAGITVSIGVVALEPYKYATAEGLIAAADAALYQAKRQGRDRVEVGTVATSGD